VYDVDAGCHASYDRFVIRARFAKPGYDVRYVKKVVADGSGKTIPLFGKARLLVVIRDARGHSEDGQVNFLPDVMTPLCPNLKQIKVAGDFEGVVSFGLGIKHKAGFRVFRLTDPRRVVVDVHH
jgi:hypothetical protein